MIHSDSRSREWLQQVADENNFPNIPLIEKVVRAFSLLESLVRSGCPFVFKGGTREASIPPSTFSLDEEIK